MAGKMKFIVTGGAGFIGSAVIRYIIKNTEHKVLNIDKLTYAGNLDSLLQIKNSDNYSFVNADICNRTIISNIFNEFKPDVIMHLAAESHVDRSIDGASEFIQTNIIGTYNLLEISKEYWLKQDEIKKNNFRFHHISTDEVYGDLDSKNDYFRENTPYAPSSPYSASKASSDHLVRAWNRTYGLPTVVTNCSNNYGPYHFPEKLIPLVIINALKGYDIPIYGNGQQIRDWLYVEDHAKALYRVATKGDISETYNIGGNNEKTNLEVVVKVCQILDEIRPKISGNSYSEQIIYVADRPGHDRRYAIDASKIQKELDWHPDETFDSGIEKTVHWYLENQHWWQKILDKHDNNKRIGLG